MDAWGSSANDLFIVGQGRIILHGNGAPCPATTTIPPTVIEPASFTATPYRKAVILEWQTESEIDNIGFNLYRSESEKGGYIRINESLIPAEGSPPQGASYEFVDSDVKNRKTYWYKLEDVDLNGTATMHGPITATPRLIFGSR
jgi:hypothetical protein